MKNTLKRMGAMSGIIVIMVMIMTMFSFADSSLSIKQTYPVNGATNTTRENMCVKFYFNHPVGNAASRKTNANKFRITDDAGHKLPVKIYYQSRSSKYALVLVDTVKVPQRGKGAIKDNAYYTCTIDKGFMANDGATLASDKQIKFKTLNQRTYTMGYMVMMALMFGGMMFFGVRQMRNQGKENNKEKGKKQTEERFNPYKEAKRTGKSVQEVVAEHNKEEKKSTKKSRRKRPTQDEILKKEEEELKKEIRDDYFKVKAPAPISAGGGKTKSGRAEAAQARREKEAAAKAARKASGYGKYDKKNKRK